MRLKVGAKIALGFGVVLLILFSMGGYSYYKAAELDDLTSDLARANKRADAAVKVQSNYIAAVLAARGYMIYGDENFAKQSDQNFNEALKGFGDILKNTKNPTDPTTVASSLRNGIAWLSIVRPATAAVAKIGIKNLHTPSQWSIPCSCLSCSVWVMRNALSMASKFLRIALMAFSSISAYLAVPPICSNDYTAISSSSRVICDALLISCP